MDWSVLLPLLFTASSTGLTCGLSCGACGTPVVNIFLASYLFTHTGRMKRSLIAFTGYHLGKTITVTLMCMLISWFGSQIVDDAGRVFGINLQSVVYAAMLVFMLMLIVQWFRQNWRQSDKDGCCGCTGAKQRSDRFIHMLVYGMISGMSPCASLLVVLGYASALSTVQAIFVGACFSLANSLVPLLLLVALTGLLSKEMFREIPYKIKYFQLATYMIFSAVLAYNVISSLIGG